jgi:hypothetical protein
MPYYHIAEFVECYRRGCREQLLPGSEVYMHSDGSIECLNCRPKQRPKVVDVELTECLACGAEMHAIDGETGCSSKCRRRLKRVNRRSADRALAATQ